MMEERLNGSSQHKKNINSKAGLRGLYWPPTLQIANQAENLACHKKLQACLGHITISTTNIPKILIFLPEIQDILSWTPN